MTRRKGRERAGQGSQGKFALPLGAVAGDYGQIECFPDERGVLLTIDGVESSYVDADDPTFLEFEYMQQMDAAVAAFRGEGEAVRALHLGGGGCALARAWAAARPQSVQLVVEYDGVLAARVRDWFGLPRAPRLRIRHGEARAVLAGSAAHYDVIVRDVFVGREVPAHVRTSEFYGLVVAHLAAGGVYVANVPGRPPLTDVRREVATAAHHFPYVALLAFPAVLAGRRYGNVVLVATCGGDWQETDLARRLARLPIPATLLAGQRLVDFAAGQAPFFDPVEEGDGDACCGG